MIEDLTTAAEAVAAPESPDPVAEQEPVSKEPLPDLNESLQKIPENSRELIDELFRGHFVGMKTIDRSKLY